MNAPNDDLNTLVESGRRQPRLTSLTHLWRFARLDSHLVELAVFKAGQHKPEGGPRLSVFGHGLVYVEGLAEAERFFGVVGGDGDPGVVPEKPLFGTGYYIVPAVINPEIRKRYADGAWSKANNGTAGEKDVTASNIIVIDIDVVRVTNTNSTNAQYVASLKLAWKIRTGLIAAGAPETALAFGGSGNGAHLLVALDMPWAPEVKAKREEFLGLLKIIHETDALIIDTSMADGARYIPAYGTMKKKAPHRDELPQRRTWLVAPDTVAPLSFDEFSILVGKFRGACTPEMLAKLGKAKVTRPAKAGATAKPGNGKVSDLDLASEVSIREVASRLGLDVDAPTCPWCGATKGFDLLDGKGINIVKCQHSTCGSVAAGPVRLVAKVALGLDDLKGDAAGCRAVVDWFVSEGLIVPGRPSPKAEALALLRAESVEVADDAKTSTVINALMARVPASARGEDLSEALAPISKLLVEADDLELDRVAVALNERLGRGAPKKVLADTLRKQRTAAKKASKAADPDAVDTDFQIGDCVELAKRLVEDLGGRESAVFDEGSVHRYDDSGVWEPQGLPELHTAIGEYSGKTLPKGVVKLSRDGIKGIRAQAEDMIADPGWFRDQTPGFAFRNGFVVIEADGSITMVDHDRSHRATYSYDFDWEPERESTKLIEFYSDIFKGDPEAGVKAQFLLEFYGASLIGEAWRAGKAVIKVGNGNDGKSTETAIMAAVFPAGTVSAVSPHDWVDDQKVAKLAPSRLNYAGELSSKELTDTSVTKAVITGTDRITAKVVYRPPFDFYSRCGHVMGCNLPFPGVSDNSRGFWRRWVIIEFTRSFLPEEENKLIVEEVTSDMQSIAITLIKAAAQFVGNGYQYTEIPPSSEALQGEWQAGAEPVRRYVNDHCQFSLVGMTEDYLWSQFKQWAEHNQHMRMSSATFRGRLCSLMRSHAQGGWAKQLGSLRTEIIRAGYFMHTDNDGIERRRYPITLTANSNNEESTYDD
jgi:P4 family phage/plasmid primase-like protien